MAWGLGQAHTSGNNGFEDFAFEKFGEVGGDLTCEVRPIVVHGEEDTLNG